MADSEADSEKDNPAPRHLSLVALQALANYKAAGLVGEEEVMHEKLAKRLARMAAQNDWEA